jgi:hypothetical protein
LVKILSKGKREKILFLVKILSKSKGKCPSRRRNGEGERGGEGEVRREGPVGRVREFC